MSEGFHCKVIYGKQLTEPFKVQTGVKQRCVLSPISPILPRLDDERNLSRKTKTLLSFLEDLDFADDITLLVQW
jgi:hypothetical protein